MGRITSLLKSSSASKSFSVRFLGYLHPTRFVLHVLVLKLDASSVSYTHGFKLPFLAHGLTIVLLCALANRITSASDACQLTTPSPRSLCQYTYPNGFSFIFSSYRGDMSTSRATSSNTTVPFSFSSSSSFIIIIVVLFFLFVLDLLLLLFAKMMFPGVLFVHACSAVQAT